jgi:hypothetical protein
MGAHPWYYFVAYQPNIQKALDTLRQREFRAGRYNPVEPFPEFPVNPEARGPGAKHASIEAALEASDADGTRSILDISRVNDTPDYSTATPLSGKALLDLYGTDKPTKEMILENMDFFEDIERGQGIYMVVYSGGKPSEILFAGYSFD